MTIKALFGLTIVPAGFLAGIIVACLSKRIRDLFFLLLVLLAPVIERLDVNFVSRDFYRGTSLGFEVSILHILAVSLLVSSILVPRAGQARGYWPPSLGFMLLLFLYACFNVAVSDPRIFGEFELFKMLNGMIVVSAVAFYLRSERELRLLIFALALAVAWQGLLALKQRYINGIHRIYGTVDDSNSLSVFFCTTTPVVAAALAARIPKLLKALCAFALAVGCVGEVLTISRAGVVIIAIVLVLTAMATVSVRITPKKIAFSLIIFIAAAGVTAKSWKTLRARFAETTLGKEYASKKSMGRGYYLRVAQAISEDNWLGVGLNNWSYWVSQKYGPKLGYRFVPYNGTERDPSRIVPPDSNVDEAQAAPAHSLGALTLGELGIPGFILFALLWLRWFQMGGSFLWPRTPDPLRRIGVGLFFGFCGMFLQSLTEWVFRHLPLYYTFHILLGTLVSLYYLKRQEQRAAKAQLAGEIVVDGPAMEPVPAFQRHQPNYT